MRMVRLNMISGRVEGEDDLVTETFKPVIFDAGQVRDFYPRRNERPGTRIVFRGGSGLPVRESFDEVATAMQAALEA